MDLTSPHEILFALLFGHAIADYALQSEFMAKRKSAWDTVPGVPWYTVLSAHCMIHAGFVWLFTGSVALGIAEFIVHFIIDMTKCKGNLSFNTDQLLHILCKVIWVTALISFIN